MPGVAHSVARLPGAANLDSLVTTGPTGLTQHTYTGPGAGSATSPPYFQSQLLWAQGGWAGAHRVRVGALTGSIGNGFAAVSTSRRAILTLRSLGNGTFTAGPTVATAGTITDFVLFDSNADGVLEIAALTDLGLELFDQAGLPLHFLASQSPGGSLAVLARAGGDEVVWATAATFPATGFVLERVKATGAVGTPFSIDSTDVVGMRCTDHDADGDQDLLLSIRNDAKLLLLVNTAGLPAAYPCDG